MEPSRARLAALLCGLVLSAVALVGCSSEGTDGAPTPAELRDSPLIVGAYANPLDAVMFPDENQGDAIATAIEARLTACMSTRGLTYVDGDGIRKRRTAEDAQYTYSVTDPQIAATYGFHPASWVKEAKSAKSEPAQRPEGYESALVGDPGKKKVTGPDGTVIASYDPDSCLGKAMDTVTPHWAQQEQIDNVSSDILLAAADELRKDADVIAKEKAWSSCMAKRGYDYATPMDANNDPQFATDFPTAAEIPVAVASATCQHSSGLLRTWSKVRAELTQKGLDQHPGIVTQWLEFQRDAAQHAGGS